MCRGARYLEELPQHLEQCGPRSRSVSRAIALTDLTLLPFSRLRSRTAGDPQARQGQA